MVSGCKMVACTYPIVPDRSLVQRALRFPGWQEFLHRPELEAGLSHEALFVSFAPERVLPDPTHETAKPVRTALDLECGVYAVFVISTPGGDSRRKSTQAVSRDPQPTVGPVHFEYIDSNCRACDTEKLLECLHAVRAHLESVDLYGFLKRVAIADLQMGV